MEHGDCLNSFYRVGVFDDSVSAALAVLVLVQLDRDHAPGQAEDLPQLLVVDAVHQLLSKGEMGLN